MADLPQYSGVTYDQEYFKLPEETMYEYMQRLAKLRAQGVLGGGGMLDIPAPVEAAATAPLGEVVVRKRRSGSGAGYDPMEGSMDTRSREEIFRDSADYILNGPRKTGITSLDTGVGMMKPFLDWNAQTNVDYFLDNIDTSTPEGAEKKRLAESYLSAGYGPQPSQENRMNYLGQQMTEDFNQLGQGVSNTASNVWSDIQSLNPLSLVDSVVGGLFGNNTPEQAAAIPVVNSMNVNTRTAGMLPQLPTVMSPAVSDQAEFNLSRSLATGSDRSSYSPTQVTMDEFERAIAQDNANRAAYSNREDKARARAKSYIDRAMSSF